MAFVKGIESRPISINIDKTQALSALAQELEVYCYFKQSSGQFYKIEDNKMYSYDDISYHGSPSYEKSFLSEDELLIKNYRLICELEEANRIRLEYY